MKGRDKGISMKPASLECAMLVEKYRALPQQNGRWEASLKSCLLISMCALYPRHAHNMHVHIEIKLMQQMLLYGLCEHQAHMWCIYINSGETYIHIRYFFSKEQWMKYTMLPHSHLQTHDLGRWLCAMKTWLLEWIVSEQTPSLCFIAPWRWYRDIYQN